MNCNADIKFVSYSGRFPNLCGGILTVLIDGKVTKFGRNKDCDYPSFWQSGGGCDWSERSCWEGDWCSASPCVIFSSDKENELFRDRLLDVMNTYVPRGCCGGCV